jgi:hypothetical protein
MRALGLDRAVRTAGAAYAHAVEGHKKAMSRALEEGTW